MAEKPILFNTEMVKAILDGRKTTTRRIISNKEMDFKTGEYLKKLPYAVGDTLWVRETWNNLADDDGDNFVYKADGGWDELAWRPSIHMPREAARLFLKVTDIRVERLNDITEEQAIAEGLSSKFMFMAVWDAIYNNALKNPWVWVIEFERIR